MKQNLRFLMLALLCAVFSTTWGQTTTGTIYFGPAIGSTTIDRSSVSGTDNLNNTWTITTVGTSSFTNNSQEFSQVGSGSKPASSITFTTSLSNTQTITNFSAKFGGFSKTTGDVTLKVGTTTVGSGSLNKTNDVTVSSAISAQGTELTVTVTNIKGGGVKCYYISYTIDGDVPTHTVTYVCDDNTSQYTYGENATINLADAPTKEGCFFIGWSDGTTTYNAGASYTVTQDVTFTAQWTKGTETWVKTDLANLTESDVFVFVGKRDGNNYAMDNTIDTNTNPQAVSVTVSDNEETLVGTVAENIKWNIENANGGYYFHPNGSDIYYLASQSSSTGLRVGNSTYSSKTFKLAGNNYLMNNETSRYLGVYIGTGNNPRKDWRAYLSTSDIDNQTFAFYKKVIVLAEISLNENEDNTTAISDNNETHINVKLTRSLVKHMWNAICLPFAMDDAQRKALFGEGYILQEMSSAELDDNGTAQLNFTKVNADAATVAGTPYLVKPTQDVTTDVILNDVKIVKATNGKPAPVENNGYKFQGIYNPTALADMGADPENILFLGRNSQLLTPSSNSGDMKGFRAYFILPANSNGASALSLSTEDGGIINSISLAEVDGLYTNMDNNRVYSISGQYIGTKTEGLAKGIYIVNGRKFIVK